MIITCNGYKFFFNKLVHGVPFEEAAECIFSTQTILIEDVKHSTDIEKRFNIITIGPSGRVLFVGFCKRQQGLETRIISARPASRSERKKYKNTYGENLVFNAITHKSPTLHMKFLW